MGPLSLPKPISATRQHSRALAQVSEGGQSRRFARPLIGPEYAGQGKRNDVVEFTNVARIVCQDARNNTGGNVSKVFHRTSDCRCFQ